MALWRRPEGRLLLDTGVAALSTNRSVWREAGVSGGVHGGLVLVRDVYEDLSCFLHNGKATEDK